MEKESRCCTHCHQMFLSIRNPSQQYCSQAICQTARKRHWQKQKRAKDPDYHHNQQRAEQSWRQRHPDYWKRYRANHPGYTQRNREQQRIRQRQWRLKQAASGSKKNASPFANSDAFDVNTYQKLIKSGTYCMIPVTHPAFANSDVFVVKMVVITIG
jgi:hypothetical protein